MRIYIHYQRFDWIIAAMILTLLNAGKVVVVDDTAYLRFAEQIMVNPLDPYGFRLMWSSGLDPAFETLAPPVHLYVLAICMKLLGGSVFVFKLGLFPMILLFCWSVRNLTRSLLNSDDSRPWIAIVGSAAVLPMWNCMIDLPAITFGLTGLAFIIRNESTRFDPWVAGLLIGLAMQTKYTAFTFPAAIVWYGMLYHQWRAVLITLAVSITIFIGWEILMNYQYGHSHFLYHLQNRSQSTDTSFISSKSRIIRSMLVYIALFTGPSLLLLIPLTLGGRSVERVKKAVPSRRTLIFLAVWLAIELAGCIAMSPFPAARRYLMIAIVTMMLIHALWYRYQSRSLSIWYVALILAIGLGLHGIDSWDARAAKTMAHRVREAIPADANGRIWFEGTWGWKYYCEQQGMKQYEPGKSKLQPGDWLVECDQHNHAGRFRPMIKRSEIVLDPNRMTLVTELIEDDWLTFKTIPELYGQVMPIGRRWHARFQVRIYRITQ